MEDGEASFLDHPPYDPVLLCLIPFASAMVMEHILVLAHKDNGVFSMVRVAKHAFQHARDVHIHQALNDEVGVVHEILDVFPDVFPLKVVQDDIRVVGVEGGGGGGIGIAWRMIQDRCACLLMSVHV
jgi:hypothetical protein